jgi:hypothetical protein
MRSSSRWSGACGLATCFGRTDTYCDYVPLIYKSATYNHTSMIERRLRLDLSAASLPFKALLLTAANIEAPVDVELAPRRREAVTGSGRWERAGCCGGQVRPGHGGGVVNVQVLYGRACAVGCIRRGRAAGSRGERRASRDCGRPRPGRAGGGGGGQTARESGDGGKARAARVGLDGGLGLRPHIRCDVGQRGAPSNCRARLVGGRAPSLCYPVTAAVEAVGRACYGVGVGVCLVWARVWSGRHRLIDSRPCYDPTIYIYMFIIISAVHVYFSNRNTIL